MSVYNPKFSEAQVKGFYNIIKGLPEQVILDLTDSVTKKTIKVFTAKEAFDAIISFSASPEELFQRKKITRNLLMQYAFDEKICITGSADKKEIISKILSHWNNVQLNPKDLVVPSIQPKQQLDYESYTQQEEKVNTVSCNQPETVNIGDLGVFGQTFASWFYKMLNSHNQQMNTSPPMDFGPQHFWPDSALQVNTMTDTTVIGAASTADRLMQFVKEGLYFNANLNDGVSTKSESHGLICVLVHGTVHKEQYCLGPFEQAFTLLQDPSNGNNWKIKNIWLNVHSASKANEPHRLPAYQTITN